MSREYGGRESVMLTNRQKTYCRKAIAEDIPKINERYYGLLVALLMHMLNGTLYLKGAVANDILSIKDFSAKKVANDKFVEVSELLAPKDVRNGLWSDWGDGKLYYCFDITVGERNTASGMCAFNPKHTYIRYPSIDGIFYFKNVDGTFVEINLDNLFQALKGSEGG